MVEDHRVEAEPRRFRQGLVARSSAIDRHEKAGAVFLECAYRLAYSGHNLR